MESGWNVWVWLVDVVVRRYIDFLVLLIATPLVSVIFTAASLLFVHFLKCFFVLVLYILAAVFLAFRRKLTFFWHSSPF